MLFAAVILPFAVPANSVGEKTKSMNLDIFKKTCSSRKKIMTTPVSTGMAGMLTNYPIEVDVGGATVFVLDVDRFEKI